MRFILLGLVFVLAGCGPTPDSGRTQADVAIPLNETPRTAAPVPPVSIAGSFRHVLRSETIGQDFLIDVVLPLAPSDARLPAIYVTDGNTMLPIAANSARLLQLGGELPPAIFVGIGYPATSTEEVLSLRMRELTPTATVTETEGEAPSGGGAAAFLDFIEEEVKPFIEATYPVDPSDSTLVGDSLGGLFTLYALFNRTSDYQRYLAGSPSIWWDGEALFDDERAYAERAADLDVDVFISVGSLEEMGAAADAKMVTNTQKMASILRDREYPNLRLTEHVFEGETHLSVIPATFSRGLREVFAGDVEAMREARRAEAGRVEAGEPEA